MAYPDPLEAAREYRLLWPNVKPELFRDSGTREEHKVDRAFGAGDGWASRFLMAAKHPARLDLKAHHLGWSADLTDLHSFFDPVANAERVATIKKAFPAGPLRWSFEIGYGDEVHPHVFGDLACCELDLPDSRRIF